jgi:hypothetical protein
VLLTAKGPAVHIPPRGTPLSSGASIGCCCAIIMMASHGANAGSLYRMLRSRQSRLFMTQAAVVYSERCRSRLQLRYLCAALLPAVSPGGAEGMRERQPDTKGLYELPARLLCVPRTRLLRSLFPSLAPMQCLAIKGTGGPSPFSSMSAWPLSLRMGSAPEACAPYTSPSSPSGLSSRILLGAAGSQCFASDSSARPRRAAHVTAGAASAMHARAQWMARAGQSWPAAGRYCARHGHIKPTACHPEGRRQQPVAF